MVYSKWARRVKNGYSSNMYIFFIKSYSIVFDDGKRWKSKIEKSATLPPQVLDKGLRI